MAAPTRAAASPSTGAELGQAVSDGLVIGWRFLKRLIRVPETGIFAVLQSIMFVLLFAFVFGGAIPLPGYSDPSAYREYLMPGIFVQTIAFGLATTAIGMTADMSLGIIDRFRSLPMARSAVLTGRTVSDVIYNAGILVVLMVSGVLVGWTVRTGVQEFVAGFLLLLAFAYAMSWIGVAIGLSVPTVEAAQGIVFTTIFPLTFVSNVFVPLATLPDWLRPIAEWNPVSVVTAATRELWGNPTPPTGSTGLPAEEPLLLSITWIIVLTFGFGALAIRRYRHLSR
jgi:ABC transporter DrrB family efflux protein